MSRRPSAGHRAGRNLIELRHLQGVFPQLVAARSSARPLPAPVLSLARSVGRTSARAVLILGGLFKKIVVANYLAEKLADPVFANPAAFHGPTCCWASTADALQIYCDFSAYFRHRHRRRAAAGLRLPGELQRAVLRHVAARILAPLAHLALHLAARLPLHPAGRLARLARAHLRQLFVTFLLGACGTALVDVRGGGARCTGAIWWRSAWWPAARPGWGWPLRAPGPLARTLQRILIIHFVCLTWFFFRAQTSAMPANCWATCSAAGTRRAC